MLIENNTSPATLFLIESTENLQNVCHNLKSHTEIAVDLEGNSLHHYKESISLIQISVLGIDYIIDPLKIDDLSALFEILTDASIQKVMHGSDFDVMSLQRDFGVKINNLFDTQIAAYLVGEEGLSLAFLLEKYFAVELEKSLQKHDWSSRPLEQNHLSYARSDTHWLLALKEILIGKLQKESLFDASIEESYLLSQKEFVDRKSEPTAYLRVKGSKKLSPEQKKRLYFLWALREDIAEKRDLPPFKIFSDSHIISLCQLKDCKTDIIAKIIGHRNATRYANKIQNALVEGDQSHVDPPQYKRILAQKIYGQDIVINQLKEWRSSKNSSNVRMSLLPTNQQLKDISQIPLQSIKDIQQNMRNWQFQMWGEEIWNKLQPSLEKINKRRSKQNSKKQH